MRNRTDLWGKKDNCKVCSACGLGQHPQTGYRCKLCHIALCLQCTHALSATTVKNYKITPSSCHVIPRCCPTPLYVHHFLHIEAEQGTQKSLCKQNCGSKASYLLLLPLLWQQYTTCLQYKTYMTAHVDCSSTC